MREAALVPAVVHDFEQLWDEAPCGYLVTGDDGVVLAVNQTFVAWSGHRREDLLGTPVRRLMPIGDQILWTTHCMTQLAIGGAVAEVAAEIVAADGGRRAVLLSATRTPPVEGRPAQVRIIVFSAHERRQYELELVAARRRAEESEARRAVVEADLHHLAWHDSLTGLLNRAGLTARLDTLLSDARAPADGDAHGELTVLFIDLDHFKAVNDSLGHAAGDELLVVVADRLRSTVRDTAVVARLAGDEFVVVDRLPDVSAAAALADRVLSAVTAPLVIEGLEIVVSASIGAAVRTERGESGEQLLRHADGAMYAAKARGRNGWTVHDPRRSVDHTGDRLRLLGELRQGIDRGELRLDFQPRTAVATGALVGVEALVRWQHPTRGLLQPHDFIEVAEESGLVRELGDWVLDEAVGQVMRWRRAGHPLRDVDMAVNLSARQLADPRLVDRVTDVLDRHGLPADHLVLEITETALMHEPEAALTALRSLKQLGVALAVDDFGTGYSSFTYLKAFPVDELKIDRSFVAGLGTDPGDRAIVASCIQLAHAVGGRAVAEGVECAEQLGVLVELGCDQAQGFLWSPGLRADDLVDWARQPGTAA